MIHDNIVLVGPIARKGFRRSKHVISLIFVSVGIFGNTELPLPLTYAALLVQNHPKHHVFPRKSLDIFVQCLTPGTNFFLVWLKFMPPHMRLTFRIRIPVSFIVVSHRRLWSLWSRPEFHVVSEKWNTAAGNREYICPVYTTLVTTKQKRTYSDYICNNLCTNWC